jgi:tetratricopeptide (TPR) repeat protein
VGARAAQALQIGDNARAAELYRKALEKAPESRPLHYGLGVSLSHLGRRDEAIRELRWVVDSVARGAGPTEETEAARGWLMRVGALPMAEAIRASTLEDLNPPGSASLEGQALTVVDNFGTRPRKRLQLFLIGRPDGPTADEFHQARTDEEGRFRFAGVVPGLYKLSDRVAGQPLWRLRVEVKPGAVDLGLSPENGLPGRDDFPGED